MKITTVTISGADDGVSHTDLQELSAEFPFVEWGILISKGRMGTPRYPSSDWLRQLQAWLPRCSFHLCGEHARDVMGGDPTMVPRGIKRMQLNGFSNYRLPCLLAARHAPDVEFILQCQTGEALAHAEQLHQDCPNISALWDPSGGEGKWFMESGVWYPRAVLLPIGYAGGIDESNIEDCIEALSSGTGRSSWIDLESGARTEDRFDVDKVRRLLKLAAPLVSP